MIIAMAAVIGECLTVSGGAERVVNWLVQLWGEKRAGVALALALAGLILAIPVFFDTVFLLLLPLARVLAVRTGKNYLFYVLALCAGAAIAHSTVPPTPGPLLGAEEVGLSMAVAIGGELTCASLPAAGALMVAKGVGVRVSVAQPMATVNAQGSDDTLPSLWASLVPVLLPLVLIGGASVWRVATHGSTPEWMLFLGDKHVALGAGTVTALRLAVWCKRGKNETLHGLLGKPLELAGPIILITVAGGCLAQCCATRGLGKP